MGRKTLVRYREACLFLHSNIIYRSICVVFKLKNGIKRQNVANIYQSIMFKMTLKIYTGCQEKTLIFFSKSHSYVKNRVLCVSTKHFWKMLTFFNILYVLINTHQY
jgi:hypothetical protein